MSSVRRASSAPTRSARPSAARRSPPRALVPRAAACLRSAPARRRSGASRPSASAMSSTFGRSLRSFSPNRIRNSFVVAYMNGRPTTCLRPTILIRCRSSSVLRTPDVLTPRISLISSGGNRLLVGDHRQRFERLHRQLLRAALVEQPAHPFVQIGAGDDLIAAGHFHELQSAGPLVVLLQRSQRRLHVFLRLAVEQLAHRFQRERIRRGKNERLDNRLQLGGALGRSCASASAAPAIPASRPSCLRSSFIHGGPPDRQSDAARRPGAAACRHGSAPKLPD